MKNVTIRPREETPKLWLCPFCGRWHKWDVRPSDSTSSICNEKSTTQRCNYNPYISPSRYVKFRINKSGMLEICIEGVCNPVPRKYIATYEWKDIEDEIDAYNPRAGMGTFAKKMPIETEMPIGKNECKECKFHDFCSICRNGDGINWKEEPVNIWIGLSWTDKPDLTPEEYESKFDSPQNPDNAETTITEEDMEENDGTDSAASSENIGNPENQWRLGLSTDKNIASTVLGTAVFNDGTWKIYNKAKKSVVDIGDIKINSLPVYFVPSLKASVGDMLKEEDGSYSLVTDVSQDRTESIDIATGEIKMSAPVCNMLGLSCYTKVIAAGDMFGFGNDDFDAEDIAMLSAASDGGSGMNALFSMLMMDSDTEDCDRKRMLMMAVTMSADACSESSNAFLPLMLMAGRSDNDGEVLKTIALITALNGCCESNAFILYLIMDKLLSQK